MGWRSGDCGVLAAGFAELESPVPTEPVSVDTGPVVLGRHPPLLHRLLPKSGWRYTSWCLTIWAIREAAHRAVKENANKDVLRQSIGILYDVSTEQSLLLQERYL
jgi:hypothetical protein